MGLLKLDLLDKAWAVRLIILQPCFFILDYSYEKMLKTKMA